ncbi:MAG: hypothetical protein EXS37_10620 [Opitutus sp.]|nr:hypothetical protein [Opitutus sp.]
MITVPSLLRSLVLSATVIGSLNAQEEADRPVGEATGRMIAQHGERRVPLVLPSPQEIHHGPRQFKLGPRTAFGFGVDLAGETQRPRLLPVELRKRVAARVGVAPADDGPTRVVFALNARDLPGDVARMGRQLATLHDPEGYVIVAAPKDGPDRILVLGKSEAALWRALTTLAQLFEIRGADVVFPEVEIIDHPQMQERGLLIDIGGQGYMVGPSRWNFAQWRQFVDWMVDQKFNALWIEFIGSGRLMGNLNIEAGEWIGFPLALKTYPQLVCRDRPIRRWDEAKRQVVSDIYTAPNVEKEFCRELIEYAQAGGWAAICSSATTISPTSFPSCSACPPTTPRTVGPTKFTTTSCARSSSATTTHRASASSPSRTRTCRRPWWMMSRAACTRAGPS